ncbi:cytochrome c oxidase subunit 5A, mitochondrial-like [Ochlerotatus camptorhynchus]|uniref:cytochrome c oxidase subunit 5A, mitochondrial-like n=1 Tax=Ochlerotatus camptorhynchus TaxID=644619 RepID=UPI0031D8B919
MLRSCYNHLRKIRQGASRFPAGQLPFNQTIPKRQISQSPCESDGEFDARYEAYFNRPDIDGWEARKAMNDLLGMDLVPEPKIIVSALKACRRLNDYALAIRFLEAVKDRCGDKEKQIYPYLLQEIKSTLCDLGIDTPEELGYDQPELAMKTIYDLER